MTSRYEAFNEVTFESYIRAAIDKSILKERMRKAARSRLEQPYSTFPDAMLYELSGEDAGISRAEENCRIFQARGTSIPVYGDKLGQALACLLPNDREIILLYFFSGRKTAEIARMMAIDPSTVRRRRKAAMQRMREFLENTT